MTTTPLLDLRFDVTDSDVEMSNRVKLSEVFFILWWFGRKLHF